MKKGLLVIAISSILLSGCVISIDDDYGNSNNHSSWTEIEQENREKISSLNSGAAIETVRRSMGVPDFDELLVKNDREHRVLFYRTQRIKGDGNTTKEECTPILFVDGMLVGFGESALNAI